MEKFLKPTFKGWLTVVGTLTLYALTANIGYYLLTITAAWPLAYVVIHGAMVLCGSIFIAKWFFPGVLVGATLTVQSIISIIALKPRCYKSKEI